MKEIIRISLDNEMDLILAHKRTMKLSELCGLNQPAQTRFATAVSEIARCSIVNGEDSYLVLGINFLSGGKKEVSAAVFDNVNLEECNPEAYAYASRIAKNIETRKNNGVYEIILNLKIPYSGLISENRFESFVEYFRKEAPLSPYDELRKRNIQLVELSEKLSESESNYRQLTDTLPLIVFSVNGYGKITLENKRLKELLGNDLTDFSNASIERIFHPVDKEAALSGWEMAKRRRSAFTLQARIKINEVYVWYLISIVPNNDIKDESSGWIISMVDINAQKLIEETLKDNHELREAQESLRLFNEELTRKNKELEQFAYIASHDLQEPLRKIMNFTSLAQRNMSEEEKERLYFNKINLSADRMSRLIIDVLNYSKASVKETSFLPVDLNGILTDVINDLEFQVQEKNASVTADELPVINGISVQLNQLFYNLIGNSLKFATQDPVINITYRKMPVSDPAHPGMHRISFADNGIGIEEKHISKLFTIFRRLHAQNEYEGTGIGLALCKKIAENHQGTIAIESVPGHGTTVSVYLPVDNYTLP